MKRVLNLILARGLIPVLAFLSCASPPLRAATDAENNAFGAAIKELKDGGRVGLALAESDFAEIAKKYPASERYPEAILYQAQARFELAKAHQGSWSYKDVIELLTAQQSRMGKLGDQYHYWIAEASFQSGNYVAAATAFDWVVTYYTNSTKLRECIYGAAEARAKQKDWPGVIDQLGRTNGAFQGLARTNPTNDWVLRGNLLLSEAQYLQRDYSGAKNTLQILSQQKLDPELDWRRQYLLCEVQMGEGHPEQALPSGTNLIQLARNTGKASFLADSITFQAGIFEELGRLDTAIDIYTNSLKELPVERQRQAQLKIIELTLRQNRADVAAQKLEEFIARNTNGPNADLALLTLGELRLKAYFEGRENASAASGGTNLLNEALVQFDRMTLNFTNSEFLGQAQLDRGWCFWTQGKVAESLAAFGAAFDRLPVSVEKAVACFKKADCLYAQKDFARAVTNYNLVIDQYGSDDRVKSELFEPALYQIVRANLEQNNLPAAEKAMRRILREYPGGLLTDHSMLLVGQAFNRQGSIAQARQVFYDFEKRMPKSPLLPEVGLAIARAYQEEADWTEAIKRYDAWTASYTNDPALPRAEYYRALAQSQVGGETNAFALFTNFVARFPTNELALPAKFWTANYYFKSGDFVKAEKNYEEIFENPKWAGSKLFYEAMMGAGRAAVARADYRDAIGYFTNLTSNPKCPTNLWVEAAYAYGDAMIGLGSTVVTNVYACYSEAIGIFNSILVNHSNSFIAPRVLGRKGDCYLQLGGLDPQDSTLYVSATNVYQAVIDSKMADISVRSQAEIGLAIVLEKMAAQKGAANQNELLESALAHYLNVVYGKNLRDGEHTDVHWLKEAGLGAARLAEELGEWQEAVNLYQRLIEEAPPLRPDLENRIKKAVDKMVAQRP